MVLTKREEKMTEVITERWINLKEAATYLGMSRTWFYQKGHALGLPYVRVGTQYRYKISDLDVWMKSQKQSK